MARRQTRKTTPVRRRDGSTPAKAILDDQTARPRGYTSGRTGARGSPIDSWLSAFQMRSRAAPPETAAMMAAF